MVQDGFVRQEKYIVIDRLYLEANELCLASLGYLKEVAKSDLF